MKAYVEIDIKGTKEAIWNVIADIEHSDNNITAIEKIEILEKPEQALLNDLKDIKGIVENN